MKSLILLFAALNSVSSFAAIIVNCHPMKKGAAPDVRVNTTLTEAWQMRVVDNSGDVPNVLVNGFAKEIVAGASETGAPRSFTLNGFTLDFDKTLETQTGTGKGEVTLPNHRAVQMECTSTKTIN